MREDAPGVRQLRRGEAGDKKEDALAFALQVRASFNHINAHVVIARRREPSAIQMARRWSLEVVYRGVVCVCVHIRRDR